ncbi:methyl-accepting chemotaxis protein [Halobiforma haloterrestris]|uniref:Methyl-accepting chemotaxis protein n=1 Tax=Natronobacterium haloterrestre TaxID=148448 RepID=A0A1I1EGZ9_NATHA|nr:methyl-accepting chemotaxis protein [Halobiforma haloterrestris]SFB84250.1 methyl-accepting chemotaxis protein [Halobiforma haloterrestris]
MSLATTLVPSFIRRSYLAKFVLAILTIVLVIGVVGAGSYVAIDDTVRADANAQLETTAEMQADEISTWMESMSVQTRTASSSPVLQEGNPQEVQGHLVEEQARMGVNVRAIHYVDTDADEIVTSTTASYRDRSLADLEEPWRDHDFDAEFELDEEVWYTESAYESPTLNDQVMAFASPVPDRDDRVVVVIGTLEYQIEQLHLENTSESTSILDADGNDVFRADEASSDVDDDALEAALGGRVGLVNDEETVQAYVPVSDTRWVAVSSVPTDEAYGVAASVRNNVLTMLLVSLGGLSLVGVVLGRQTVGPLRTLQDRAAKMESGNLEVDLETNRIDEIGQLFDGFDSMRVALRDQIEEAEAAREEAERERERVEAINVHLEEKADEYSDVMGAAAAGDLTARMDTDSTNEAMAEIAAEFNEMLAEIEATVAGLNRFATEVATASEQVTSSSEEVRSASQQVSESIQEISDGAERQNESLQSANQEMSALSTTTEEIAASSNEVADLAERTANTGEDGQEPAREAIAAMDEIEVEAGDAVAEMRRLEEEVQQIDELIATISEIARQTNMLALNANIEASRSASGEDDEGFTAVAQEVKTLSEDVAEAADEAEERLEAIRERTERSAAEVEDTTAEIEDAGRKVQEAVDALEEIADLAGETNVGVQEISAATEEQAASTEEVVAMVDGAATISEETTAEAENVAAAAEEQTSALTEVTESASSLSEQAVQLSEALDRFDTDAEPADLETAAGVEASADAASGDDETPSATAGDDGAAVLGAIEESEPDREPNPADDGDADPLDPDVDSADRRTDDDDEAETGSRSQGRAGNGLEDADADGETDGDVFTFEDDPEE